MSEMLHVMRKDALRLRWMLVLWLAVLAARVASMVSGWNPTDDLSRTELALLMSSRMMTFVELLLAALITTRLVHEEPLVGPTAFWLTRPYHRGSLLGAKLSFLLVVLVVLPLLADLATMASLGAGTRALVAEGPLRAIDYLGTVLPLMVIAAITPSLSAFVLTVVGIAGTGLSAAALASLARTLWPAEPGSYAPPGVPDATPGVVMLAMYLCTGLAVVAYQYHRRGRQGAALLAGAGLAATLVVPQIWPWSFARAEGYEPGTWAATAAAVHDPSWDIEGAVPPGRGASGRRLMARVTLSGAPPEITVASTGVRGTLRMPDGAVIESGQGGGYSAPFRYAALEAALGGIRLLTDREERVQELTPVIALTEDELSRHAGSSGRIDADVYFMILRTREVASIPLAEGAAYDDGLSRVEITDVRRRPGGLDVAIRQSRARSLLPAEPRVQSQWLVLRNRARREALLGDSLPGRASVVAGSSIAISRALVGNGEALFTASTTVARFPEDSDQVPALDPTWFDEAELVVLRTELAGVVTKPLTIDNFVIPES